MSLPDNYDVEEAERLLRWIGNYASDPAHPGVRMLLEDIKEFLDAICPTCHGGGYYFAAEDEQEPCFDCNYHTRNDLIPEQAEDAWGPLDYLLDAAQS